MSSTELFAQLSERLQHAISNDEEKFHTIRIEFKDNVDCYALNHDFKQERVHLNERPKVVITQLQQQAALSQKPVMQMIDAQLESETRNIHRFWIANVMVLEATKEAIRSLAQVPEVALIDIEDSELLPHDPIIRSEDGQLRSPNGVEPGLVAINAPAMWALGYTGRGRLVYDYDTGVWPTHPAFSERFLAHRYPMNQCWFGYFSDIPNGFVSDHGTHTLGTMTGLIEETNDTIGVAFKAYWIANDFVTTTVAALPPLANMMAAFEWALNPDGDINTTEDIPDVINNSWRWRDDPDTVQCAGPVVSLMNAIEAAGIANVFSGGNSGPGNTTVNAPQRINTSEVNTFCVGSVDGNQSFPYPISNFSTRGPSQCEYTGSLSLEIHPEVVAPGQNVRSAWGTDEFSTISGTSMAAPHVSGAILLLKEAFPYLSGEDLLWALYLTAVDLGEAGEDNIYGMGIIDVHAAFLYLSQTNTPVDPNNDDWDLGIRLLPDANDNGLTCGNSISAMVEISNLGNNSITSVNFEYNINGGSSSNFNWSGMLLPGTSETISLPAISTSEFGELGLTIIASISGQPNEYDHYNNRWYYTINRRETTPLPFVDGFEQGLSLNDWFVQNPDNGTTWDTTTTAGLNWSNASAWVECYNYSPRADQRDGLVSPLLQIPITSESVWLLFDVAYQKRTSSSTAQDTLLVSVSTNCGGSFPDEVYRKTSDELSTNDTAQLNFIPTFEWDWRRDSVSLNQYAGQDVLLRFETINRKGNNIFIDNVKVFVGDWEPAGISDPTQAVSIYPNPTESILFLDLNGLNTLDGLSIKNVLGQTVEAPYAQTNNRVIIETSSLQDGMYLIEMTLGSERVIKRFVKK